MNFNEYLNSLDLANLNDLQPNEGMEMGWYKCKEEVLKILEENKELEFVDIDDKMVYKINGNVIEKIENL